MFLGGAHDDSADVGVGGAPGQGQLSQGGPQLLSNGLEGVHLVQALIHQRLLLQTLHTHGPLL